MLCPISLRSFHIFCNIFHIGKPRLRPVAFSSFCISKEKTHQISFDLNRKRSMERERERKKSLLLYDDDDHDDYDVEEMAGSMRLFFHLNLSSLLPSCIYADIYMENIFKCNKFLSFKWIFVWLWFDEFYRISSLIFIVCVSCEILNRIGVGGMPDVAFAETWPNREIRYNNA